MERSARRTGKFFNFEKGKNLLLNLSPNFIAGKMMIVRAIIHEMNLIVAPLNSNPLLAIKDLDDPIHFGAFVPSQINSIVKDPISKEVYEKIDQVIIGGARLSPALTTKLQLLRNESFATFGMTETITHFALANLSAGEQIYECLPGFSVSVNEDNCLIVHDEDLGTAYQTNDVVDLKTQQTFHWLGRADNVINSGGIKIYPEELEKIFGDVIKGRYYFTSKTHADLGEAVVLVIEGNSFNQEDLRYQEKLRGLPKYYRPKEILFQPKFDETKNGKIIRKRF